MRNQLVKKQHHTQIFATLLLREVKELRENEKLLLSSLSKIEAKLKKRKGAEEGTEDVKTGSQSSGREPPSPAVGIVAEPVATVFGAWGACGDSSSSEEHIRSPHGSANSVVGRRFLIKVEAAKDPPSG